MITFREFLKEAEEENSQLKIKKLKIQLDAANDDLETHKRMKEFIAIDTESAGKWSEKLQSLKDKIQSLSNNISEIESQKR